MPGRIRDPGPSVKDKDLYERLRAEGGEAGPYDGWTVGRLRERAAEIGIAGRSSMRKAELIEALRTH